MGHRKLLAKLSDLAANLGQGRWIGFGDEGAVE
jgi:hypothetical protein